MKILILEDSDERIQQFKKNFMGAKLIFTQTPKEAIEQLKKHKIDILFLDHDLGGTTYADSDENSGYAVAKWLEENPEFKPKEIILHSLNPDGVAKMNAALPEARKAPFIWTRVLNFMPT